MEKVMVRIGKNTPLRTVRALVILLPILLLPICYAQILFSDDFNRNDNTTIGNGWEYLGTAGDIRISGHKLNLTRTATSAIYHDFAVQTNGSVNASFYLTRPAALNPNIWLGFHNTVPTYVDGDGMKLDYRFEYGLKMWDNQGTDTNICSGGGNCIPATTKLYISLVFLQEACNITMYVDGVKESNVNIAPITIGYCHKKPNYFIITVGDRNGGPTFIENFTISNTTTGGTPPAVTASLVGYATNKTKLSQKKTVFGEGEDFYLYANHTLSNGSVLSNSKCNATLYNASLENSASNESFTLCSSCGKSYYSVEYNVTNTSAYKDAIHFYACHTNLQQGDITLGFCGQTTTVLASSITVCPAKSFIFVNGTGCLNKDYVNYSISYTGTISRAKNITKFGNDRFFTTIKNPMLYNTTTKTYRSNSSFEYYRHGVKPYKLTCNNTGFNNAYSSSLTIVNSPPVVTFVAIQTNTTYYNFTPSIKIEYTAGNWSFYTSVTDDDLDRIVYSIRNASSVIWTKSTKTPATVTTPNKLFLDQATYNFTIFANDTNRNRTFASRKFIMNDTINPVCVGLDNHIQENGTYYNWWVNCSDQYFWQFNMSCDNGFSYFKTSIGQTNYTFRNATLVAGTNITCLARYCDAHTDLELGALDVKSYPGGTIKAGNTLLTPLTAIKGVTLQKKIDRYTFCYDFGDNKAGYATLAIPPGCVVYPNSKIQGHLACDNQKIWWDFVNPEVKVSIGDDIFLDLTGVKDLSNVCFNSIGSYNCVNTTQVIIPKFSPKNSTTRLKVNYCPDTTAGAFILWILVIISLFFMTVGFVWRVGVAGIIGAILMFVLSWTIFDCSNIFGYALGGCSLFLILIFGILSRV